MHSKYKPEFRNSTWHLLGYLILMATIDILKVGINTKAPSEYNSNFNIKLTIKRALVFIIIH